MVNGSKLRGDLRIRESRDGRFKDLGRQQLKCRKGLGS